MASVPTAAIPTDPATAAPVVPRTERERLLVDALRRRDGWGEIRERVTAKVVDFVPALVPPSWYCSPSISSTG